MWEWLRIDSIKIANLKGMDDPSFLRFIEAIQYLA